MSEAAQAAPPAPAPAAKGKTTEYLVLFFNDETGGWEEGPTLKGRTPRKAIESFLESAKAKGDEGTKFVAIPKRYWVVEEPGVETQTKIVFK